MRSSRSASAAATSAASKRCGMCCGQFASQADRVKRIPVRSAPCSLQASASASVRRRLRRREPHPDLDAPLVRIVNQEQIGSGLSARDCLGDELAVAGEIETNSADHQAPARSRGPPRCWMYGCLPKFAVARKTLVCASIKPAEFRRDPGCPGASFLHERIAVTGSLARLYRFDGGREGGIAGIGFAQALRP